VPTEEIKNSSEFWKSVALWHMLKQLCAFYSHLESTVTFEALVFCLWGFSIKCHFKGHGCGGFAEGFPALDFLDNYTCM
jgi:hypothetical protein